MWRKGSIQAMAVGACFSKDVKYPKKPKDLLPELFEPDKTVPVPDFLKEKYLNELIERV